MAQEEKVELAKDWHGSPDATEEERAHLEAISPELTESEDEKAIDALKLAVVSYCSTEHKYVKTISKSQLIAWVKKQGEQKAANKEYLLTFADLTRTFPPGTEWSYSDDMPSYIVGFNKKREILIFIEDGDKISPNGKFLVTIYRSKTGIHDTQKKMFEGTIDFKEKQEIKGLSNKLYNYHGQGHAWSEEDERIQDNCIEYIKASCLDHKELIECIEWVESLKDRIKGE